MIIETSKNSTELENGSAALRLINISEEEALLNYSPITNALTVIKCGDRYLLGFNKWRKRYEIFGGCIEEGESLRECITREIKEELGISEVPFEYIGLIHYNMAPSFFNSEWHEEYGALYGATLPEGCIDDLERLREDRDEIERLAFYDDIKGKEPVAQIDEAFLSLYADVVPGISRAENLLEEAAALNPGPWVAHSRNVAKAAKAIAEQCQDMNSDKAYVLGLLHDIGRRFGVTYLAHVYDGYHYLLELGYKDAARIALTHSFNCGKLEDYIGKFDITEEKQAELRQLLFVTKQNDYDYLIQLCDAVALPEGIVPMEERMIDVKNRYGYYPQEKWDKNICLKEYFERKMNKGLDSVLNMLIISRKL